MRLAAKWMPFWLSMVWCAVWASPVAFSDPLVMLDGVSKNLLQALQAERPAVKTNDEWIYRVVDRIVLPYVDVMGMSRSVVGRDVWRTSSVAQQVAFSRQFTHVIVKTYASALNAYTDETVRFFPIREDITGQQRVVVNSEVVRRDGPPIPLSYRLVLMNGQWKIYDLNIEGVSLLQSFYSQFSAEISKGKTIDQLTADLERRNRER